MLSHQLWHRPPRMCTIETLHRVLCDLTPIGAHSHLSIRLTDWLSSFIGQKAVRR